MPSRCAPSRPVSFLVPPLLGAAVACAAPALAQTEPAVEQKAEQTLAPVVIRASRVEAPAAAAGKGDQAIKDVPQSITVITQERIEQQSLKTLDDVMRQATGVTREQLWLRNDYYSRGLKIENIRYDNGATSVITDRNNNADLAQFESVSLLRGVDGLYGAGNAGGVISLRSKRAQATKAVTATLSAGSWANYRAELDATGPLTDNGVLKGRAVAVFEDKDHFFKPSHSRREMLYGMLQVDPSPDTAIYAGASVQKDRQDAFNASLMRYVDGADPKFPRSATMGAPWGWIERKSLALFAGLEQRLAAGWKLDLNVRRTEGRDGINGAELEGAIGYATRESDWWRYADKTRASETLVDANVQGGFEAFGQSHDVVFGIDHARSSTDYDQNWTFYGAGNAFERVAPPEWAYPPAAWEHSNHTGTQVSGVYGSLRMRPIERLSLIVGGRRTFGEQQTMLDKLSSARNEFKQKGSFTPYAGAVYELTPSVSLYASRSEIEKSQSRYLETLAGPTLKPATGSNTELGVKVGLAGGKLLASAALFDVRLENEAVYMLWSPTGSNAYCCYQAIGNKSSRGVDLELNGKLTDEWEVAFGYTFNKNQDRQEGNENFSSVTPRHILKLWSNHNLGRFVPGLSAGWGVNAQSANYRSDSVPAYNPASGEFDGDYHAYNIVQKKYAVWALRAAYEINPQWTLAANVDNVFDKRYFSTIGYSGYGNFYGEPRKLTVTLKASY